MSPALIVSAIFGISESPLIKRLVVMSPSSERVMLPPLAPSFVLIKIKGKVGKVRKVGIFLFSAKYAYKS